MSEPSVDVQVLDAGTFRTELMPVKQVEMMVGQIRSLLSSCMKQDMHYGVIPGTGKKPTLLKPGAELLNVMFRLRPEYIIEKTFHEDGHFTVHSKCRLFHVQSGVAVGEGDAICSTRESKYAYRAAKRTCPKCAKPAIYKSKEAYGGGWYCWKKPEIGGCGAVFKDGSPEAIEIEKQFVGKVPNEDLPDQYNTIIKMANKRSNIAATLSATAASEVFTQDIEDIEENRRAGNPKAQEESGAGLLESSTGAIVQVKRFNLSGSDKLDRYEVVMSGGAILKAFDDATALKAKALIGKGPVVVSFNKKTAQILKIANEAVGVEKAEAEDEGGDAQEPVEVPV
jgi:hypothetical protein